KRIFARVEIAALGRRLVIVIDGQLPDRTREADGQFARRVIVAEDNVRHARARLLPQVETFEDGRDVLRDVVDGKRATVNQQHDGRLAGFEHGADQIILHADQLKAVAVAKVSDIPALFVGVFVTAEDQQGHVRTLRRL